MQGTSIFFTRNNRTKRNSSVLQKIVSEYGQEIPQSQTADNPMALFRFLHYCSVFPTTEQKRKQCVFASLFRVFIPLFRFLHYCSVFTTMEQKRNSVFLYHGCFCTSFPFFSQRNKKTEQCVFVSLFRVFVPLTHFFALPFPFFHGTVCFCNTVPFLHFCSVFPQQNKKRKSVFSYYCSVFSYHCSVFCTTVLFFPQQNSVFLYHCSVFALLFRSFYNGTKNGTVCF